MTDATTECVLAGRGTFDPDTTPLDADGQGRPYQTYAFGAQIAEVEVDPELGTVKVRRIVAAHDVGRAINPTQVEGQIHGGIAQGLGFALMEAYVPGRTENLHDYLIPTVGDMPEIECLLIEDAEPSGPYGAKGVGEPALDPDGARDPRRDPRRRRRPDHDAPGDPGSCPRSDPRGRLIGQTAGMPTKVILDVDTGTDDAVALMVAALSPDLELVGATTRQRQHDASTSRPRTPSACSTGSGCRRSRCIGAWIGRSRGRRSTRGMADADPRRPARPSAGLEGARSSRATPSTG